MKEKVRELLARECYEASGTKVVNCMAHYNRLLTDRPASCPLCATDVSNRLSDAIAVNEWLNKWKDDAATLLRQAIQEAA